MPHDTRTDPESNPLPDLDEWEAFLRDRYPAPDAKASFRDYGTTVAASVREFYRLNHRFQTLDFVQAKRNEYLRSEPSDEWESGRRWNSSTRWSTTAIPTPA